MENKLYDLRFDITPICTRENDSDKFRARSIGGMNCSHEAKFWLITGFYSVNIMRWNGHHWEYTGPTIDPMLSNPSLGE